MSAPVDVRAWLANKVTREREIERATGLPNSERAAAESVCAVVDELIDAGNAWCDLMPGLAGGPEFDRLVAALAQVPRKAPTTSMQFTLRQAETLLAFFGGANADMTVEYFPANHWPDNPTAPAGLYVYCTEYPDEGALWLGEENNDEAIEPTWQHIPPETAASATPDVVGHKTFHTPERGFWHEPLYADEAQALWGSIEANDAQRAKVMPSEESAIRLMFEAGRRLKDFGWNDAIYCPKDRSTFQVLEFGSTGKHPCIYEGEWPSGSWWIVAQGDMSPSRPVLWKPLDAAQPEAKS